MLREKGQNEWEGGRGKIGVKCWKGIKSDKSYTCPCKRSNWEGMNEENNSEKEEKGGASKNEEDTLREKGQMSGREEGVKSG